MTEVLTELAGLGYRKILVEKPVALQESELLHIERLRRASDLELVVVAPWLASTLTERIESIVQEAPLGRLRSISVLQRKSRFSRSMAGSGHPTAFDVEMPHAVGVALALAGGATVRDARCEDMAFGDVVIPRMGRAWLDLEHGGRTRTLIHSDMTSPARERRITLDFEQGKVVGHYASGEDDNTAQLWTRAGSLVTRVVFRDDSLSTFMARTYEQFATPGVPDRDLALHCDVVRLLAQAKAACDRPAACSVPSRPNGHATPYANGSVMLQQPSGLPV
jgi:predicted dehydrogenase